ncbi:carbohydrate sulfotransferase 15 [Plakobranchus ocellatus]|uniref:Carbohydrate sulfotransferase 15 n=1 Tax=Plakobranchus ocellatus TaxID=259542 RepID=A0AAV4CKB0_9GAST|nr:carbohydrate sulfotransferase 15 [Plakobranchus ocellatus]
MTSSSLCCSSSPLISLFIVPTIRQRQLQFLGHICRHKGLEHLAITGKIEGKRSRARQRITFIENLKSWAISKGSNNNLLRIASSEATSKDTQENTRLDFRFSRQLLRLTYKSLPKLDSANRTRDITTEFQCSQSWDKLQTLGENDTEDIMCIPRPNYMPAVKNPCYMEDTNSAATTNEKVHCLPYFHVLGNDKCGTTDFHARLTQHPLVLPNNGGIGKEIYYWCWLRYGDGTPMDFWDFRGWKEDPQNAGLSEPRFLTPHAMRHIYRDPKFIVMVRNPIDRLYSDYIFLGYGFTAQKFARDVPVAISMLQKCLSVNSTRQCFFSDKMYHDLPVSLTF